MDAKKRRLGWIARLRRILQCSHKAEEEEEEQEDAAGTVDTLSNKANHSAVVLFCFNIILLLL